MRICRWQIPNSSIIYCFSQSLEMSNKNRGLTRINADPEILTIRVNLR